VVPCSCRDGDALNADEFETVLWFALHFEAQLDRFANTLRDLVQRLRLRVATRQLRDGRNVVPFFVALYYNIELAWQ